MKMLSEIKVKTDQEMNQKMWSVGLNECENGGKCEAKDVSEDGDEIDDVNERENDREDEAEDEAEEDNIEDEGDDGSEDNGGDEDEHIVHVDDSGEDCPTIEQKNS